MKYFPLLILLIAINVYARPREQREIGVGEKIVTASIWTLAAVTTVIAFMAVANAGAPARVNVRNPIACAHHVEPESDKEFLEHDCPCKPY